jgi:hypothetical protein
MRPETAAHWLPSFEGWVEPPPFACAPGCALRFRTRLRRLPARGELRVLEVTPGRVRLQLRLGLFGLDARVSLGPEPGVERATRIGLVITIANEVALVSGSLDRFEVRKLASAIAEQTLAQLASYAEHASYREAIS